MDMAVIAGAYNGLKFAKDALQVALNYKIENETRSQIAAALEKLGAVQDTLFEMREELFRLQTENQELRRELQMASDWEARRADYHLEQTAGGALVYSATA